MKVKSESEVAQSCPTLSNPMDCSLPGSSVRGIFQARVLEWGDTKTQVRVSEQGQGIARFPHDSEEIPKSGQVQDLSFCSWNSLESKVQWGGP